MGLGLMEAGTGPGAADGLVVVGLGAVEIHYGWGDNEVLAGRGFPGCEGAVDDVKDPLDALGTSDLEKLRTNLLVFGGRGRGQGFELRESWGTVELDLAPSYEVVPWCPVGSRAEGEVQLEVGFLGWEI